MTDDPFALLGVPRRFDLDPAQLQSAWLRQSAALHPDRFIEPLEQADAARRTAQLNHARQVLASPEQRAGMLLSLCGGPAKEDDKTLPDGFLMDILDVRQRMEEAKHAADTEGLREFEHWADGQRAAYIERIGAMFTKAGQLSDAEPARRETLKEIRRELNAWRYIERMREQIR